LYCEKNGIQVRTDSTISQFIAHQNGYESVPKGYEGKRLVFLKNQNMTQATPLKNNDTLIKQFSFEQLSMLEYIAFMPHLDINFKVVISSRSIPRYFWDMVRLMLAKEKSLNSILKKFGLAKLTSEYFGSFLDKEQNNSELVALLKKIVRNTEDEDIKLQAYHFLKYLGETFEDLECYPYDILENMLYEPQHKSLFVRNLANPNIIVDMILESDNVSYQNKLVNLLVNGSYSIDCLPALMRLVDNKRILQVISRRSHFPIRNKNTYYKYIVSISDKIVTRIETILGYDLKEYEPIVLSKENPFIYPHDGFAKYYGRGKNSGFWKSKWAKDSSNYRNWRKMFFKKKLEILSKAESVTSKELNKIVYSHLYSASDREIWLKAVTNMKPYDDKLMVYPKFNIHELEGMGEYLNNPDNLWSLLLDTQFETSNPILSFFRTTVNSYPEDGIMDILSKFASEDRFINWFEDQSSDSVFTKSDVLFYLNYGKEQYDSTHSKYIEIKNKINRLVNFKSDPQSRIDAVLSYKTDKKQRLLDVLSGFKYNDLSVFMNNIDRIQSVLDFRRLLDFIREDFGILISDLDKSTVVEFIEKHQHMSELEFYQYYATKSQPNLYSTSTEGLNYKIVYEALKPGGLKHYWDATMQIRILEFKHNTRLGFGRKFDNALNYRSIDIRKRTKAWLKYLKEKGLIKTEPNEVPSFKD
jgi:CRISPR/Cas system CSM-associated protein Csm2 small subunit